MASTEYFTITVQYWVRSCEFLVGFYWTELEGDSDALGSLALLLLGLETDILKLLLIIHNYLNI